MEFQILFALTTRPAFFSQDFKLFCNSFNIKLIFCTVGDHRSNGLVEKLVHTVKVYLLAMSLKQQKSTHSTKRYLKNHLEPTFFLSIKNKMLTIRNPL